MLKLIAFIIVIGAIISVAKVAAFMAVYNRELSMDEGDENYE